MEPRIQYATTSDGVKIAYAVFGHGLPLIAMPGNISHFQLAWQYPEFRRSIERLAEKRMIVQYDCRGSGLSERAISRFSVDSLVLDLEAVIDAVGLERFALRAQNWLAMTALAYTVGHPERVSQLMLWAPFVRGADFWSSSRTQAVRAVRETDWELYGLALIHLSGVRVSKQAEKFVTAFIREAITPETLKAFMDASQGFDVADLLPQIRCPTLVLHPRQAPFPPIDDTRRLASQIPRAQLMIVEAVLPWMDNTEAVLAAIDEFLGGEGEVSPAAASEAHSGMIAILFADIADSTALTERLGDAAFRAKARELGPALRAVVRGCGGTPVEGPTLGDGVLAVFTSARQAIDAALRCAAAGNDAGLPLHLGLHAGDVSREKDPDGRDNVYGGAVNIASRISGLSEPGEVLVSETVRSLARTSGGVSFEDRGRRRLKGVGESVRVWAVREQEQNPFDQV